MSKKAKGAQETEQQKAMATLAVERLADYKKRWLPLQQEMLGRVQDMGKPDSFERKKLAGKVATDNAVAFADAGTKTQGVLSEMGAAPGSSKAKLAMTGLGDDQATSKAMGLTAGDQSIDDAYLQGLSTIAALGRGQGGQAMKGMQQIANQSGLEAQYDAERSAAKRAGNAQLIGNIAGIGLTAGIQGMGGGADTGAGSVPGGYMHTDPKYANAGVTFNNPSAYVGGNA